MTTQEQELEQTQSGLTAEDLDAIREDLGIREDWTPKTEDDYDKIANYYLWCDDEERRLKDIHKLRMARIARRRVYLDYRYRPLLENYTRYNIKGSRRSVDLPSARLQLRKTAARWKISDHEKLQEWIARLDTRDRDELSIKEVRTFEYDKEVLFFRAQLGEAIPGLEYVPEGESFSVQAPKG